MFGPEGKSFATLSAIDDSAREWTEEDLDVLCEIGACMTDQILLCSSLGQTRAQYESLESTHKKTRRYNALRETLTLAFMAPDLTLEDRFKALLQAGCKALGMEQAAIAKASGGQVDIIYQHIAVDTTRVPQGLPFRTLMSHVLSGQQQYCVQDVASSVMRGQHALTGHKVSSYVGAPLLLNGVIFGGIEFSCSAPRTTPWTEEEMSLISIISMFVCAHLSVAGEIRTLRASESALLEFLVSGRDDDASLFRRDVTSAVQG